MPSRKEIQWSQLKVGTLVLAAIAVLIALIFLMTGSTGGLFAHRLVLRSYFPNAGGLKEGAPVTLEGVTIGNVVHLRVVPERNPTPVEATLEIGEKYWNDLHTDSTTSITAAGVLGDSFIDIDSTHATGPRPAQNTELLSSGAPTIQSVISTSQVSIEEINRLMKKVEILVDTINSGQGTVGEVLKDPALARKISSIATNLDTFTGELAGGKGTVGKLVNDDSLYTKLNSIADNLNAITSDLQAGKGSGGKFLKDESAYKNLDAAAANANELLSQINSGKGSLGKVVKDPVFARKLDDSLTNLDSLLKGLNEGQGSAGQFFKNRSLYEHADQTLDEAHQLIQAIRQDPKKYLVIQMKVF